MASTSQLAASVPIFDGSNFLAWAKPMRAFLMSQGLWGYASGDLVDTAFPFGKKKADGSYEDATPEEMKEYKEAHLPWQRGQDMCLGHIILRLSPSIQQNFLEHENAEGLWHSLQRAYGTTNLPTVYRDFKEATSIRFNSNTHPGAQFDKMAAAFARLDQVTISSTSTKPVQIQPQLQALIALAALPSKWEMLIPIIVSGKSLEDITLYDVRETVVSQFLTETNQGKHKAPQNANKLSAVKRKQGNPRFSKQESSTGNTPNQQQHQQRGSRGTAGKPKDKGKGKAKPKGHSHVASMAIPDPIFTTDAALPAPSSSTIAHIGASSSKVTRTIKRSPPSARVDGVYPSVNKTLSLLERMEVSPSIQTAKNIEERFLAIDKEVRARAGFTYDDDSDYSDVDMSRSFPERSIYRKTPDDLADLSGEELAHQFDYLSMDLNMFEFDEGPSRAPTPEYTAPQSIPDNVDAELEADIDAQWASINSKPTLKRKSSNEEVEEIWQRNQDYLASLNRAPTPGLPADFDDGLEEALDWGTDEEAQYAFPSFYAPDTNTSIVLAPLSNIVRGISSNLSLVNNVSNLYNVNIGALDNLQCEHDTFLLQCAECRRKVSSMWLLDSGASAHFTNSMNDFIEYKPADKNNRQAVRTAAHTIWVEGQGTVLLRHYLNGDLVTTRINPVLYIPQMNTRLLSMGEFLQQGLRLKGDSHRITLTHKNKPFVHFKPLMLGQTLFWLDALTTTVEARFMETIYKVDYDLMHRRLGHPSKEVLRHAKDHTKGFPEGMTIPTEPHVCPGCAQGKMPAASHSPSMTRATEAFKRIHSDLKSFPETSYHKYKYFIVFLDDYTSFAWIQLLRDKASAIGALKQWLALIKNQYNTTIKEWMSDAGGEYKSDAFIKILKDTGITILQSAPHTPQQNGRAERFMRTVMDKAQAMRLEACLPQSWWEFAVLHATHCYNRTPVSRLQWQTPFALLNNEIPDISHLRVFGCGAYVHIPESRRKNKLSPKSELMIYLGRQAGMKADVFMRTPNTLFYSDKALFDELLLPKCSTERSYGKVRGTTQLDEPPSIQPPHDLFDDPTPGDLDNIPPKQPKGRSAPSPDTDDEAADKAPTEQQAPPSDPDPVPKPKPKGKSRQTAPTEAPRRSARQRKVPTLPDNVYGDKPPSEVVRDIGRFSNWRKQTENRPGSSRIDTSKDQSVPGDLPEQAADPPIAQSEQSHDSEDDVEEQMLIRLAKEGGVKFLDILLAKAVIPNDLGSPDNSNIREWTYRDILKMPADTQQEWKLACREELESLRRRNVYELVDPPKGRKVIKNRWVFDLKTDGRKKARLVAKGFSQVEGIDYDEIFSPVVRFETVRMMIALAALKDWHISGLDVKTAFLYGELDEELYMEQPEGFKDPKKKHKVMRLKKAIYGLKQAALAWWRALDKSMATLNCTRLVSDSGLFVNKEKTIVIIVYVDDVLFLGANKKDISSLKQRFMKIWECRDLGDTQEFLRMRIIKSNGCIKIDQVDYLHKVLQRFNLLNAKTPPTPLPEGYQPKPNSATADPELRSKFQQVIGSLLYIMIGTRPDIAYAVTKLSQFAANPSRDHLDRALYICRYLLGTSQYALVYDGKSNGGLAGFADSDWASDPITRKSTTGFLVKLANGVFCWNSRAQKSIALSSTEAEYMSLSDASRQLVWIRSLFNELGINLSPIPLCGDNQGSIFLASNPVQEKRIKHIDLRYHYIREVIQEKKIELFFLEGSENPADLFTKNLGRIKFAKFREQLGLEFYSS